MYHSAFLHYYTDAPDTVLAGFDRMFFLSAFAREPWEKLELKQSIGWLAEQTYSMVQTGFTGFYLLLSRHKLYIIQ
ncbi:MAG: hypothetical protein IPM26_01280 [Saprospiraceae bacterium]|nr:hypothetical protein [Saprospiraceae bacterium]